MFLIWEVIIMKAKKIAAILLAAVIALTVMPLNLTEQTASAAANTTVTTSSDPDTPIYIGDWAYKKNDDGTTVTIVGYIGNGEAITVPAAAVINGGSFPVTVLDANAFTGNMKLKTVVFEAPSVIAEIGDEAFMGCANLETITLPNSLLKIRNGVFRDCIKLKTINIPAKVTEIGRTTDDQSDNKYVFAGCTAMTGFTVNGNNKTFNVTKTAEGAGMLCKITPLTIIKYPGADTRNKCTIPADIMYIEDGAFDGCGNIQNFAVESTSKYFTTGQNGAPAGDLLSDGGRRLIKLAEGSMATEYTIPLDVAEIAPGAFYKIPTIMNFKTATDPVTGANLSKSFVFSNYILYKKDSITTSVPHMIDKYVEVWVIDTATGKETNVQATDSAGNLLWKPIYLPGYNATNTVSVNGYIVDSKNRDKHAVEQIQEKDVFGKPKFDTVLVDVPVTLIKCGEGRNGLCNDIPETVTRIAERAFENSLVTDVTIPASVMVIDERAFYNSKKLTRLKIVGSVEKVPPSAFLGCNALQNIDIDSSNKVYGSTNGVLFNLDPATKAKTTLIKCAEGYNSKEYTIPNTVNSIQKYAFSFSSSDSNGNNLQTVTFTTAVPPSFTPDSNYSGLFEGRNISKLTVPNGSLDAYKTWFMKTPDLWKLWTLLTSKTGGIAESAPDPKITSARAALLTAITAATNAMSGIDYQPPNITEPFDPAIPYTPVSQLPKGKKYAPGPAFVLLQKAIEDATSCYKKSNATETELKEATTRITTAKNDFTKTIVTGTNAAVMDVNRIDLGSLIEKAKATLDANKNFVSKAASDALSEAIKGAEATYKNANATDKDIATAKDSLNAAIAAFLKMADEGKATASANKKNLDSAIAEAKKLRDSVAVLPTGKKADELAKGVKYADQKAIDAFAKAIDAASAVNSNATASDKEITAAKTALATASATFTKAIIEGTNPNISTTTPNGGTGVISPSVVKPALLKITDPTSIRGLARYKLPQNMLAVGANVQGTLNGYVSFKITAAQLKTEGLVRDYVRLYEIKETYNGDNKIDVTNEPGRVTQDADGGLTLNLARFSTYIISEYSDPPVLCSMTIARDALKTIVNGGFINPTVISKYDYDRDKKLSYKDIIGIMKGALMV